MFAATDSATDMAHDDMVVWLGQLELKLANTAVTSIEVSFYGSGDSFDGIGDIYYYDSQKKVATLSFDSNDPHRVDPVIDSIVGLIVEETVERNFEGFYNNDGGSGRIWIDLKNQSLRSTLWYQSLERENEEQEEVEASNDNVLQTIFESLEPSLLKGEITIIGCGDSGSMDECTPGFKGFEDWCFDYLSNKIPEWEINDGGGGTFTINAVDKTVDCSIWTYCEEEEEDKTVFFKSDTGWTTKEN